MKTNNSSTEEIVAVVWMPRGVAIARFADRQFDGNPRVDLQYFEDPTDVRLTPKSLCLTAPAGFNFQTRLLALDAETLNQNDAEVATFLIHMQSTKTVLEDGNLLLETALEETVAQMTRLPNEKVSITRLPREELAAVQNPCRELFFNGLEGEKKEREEARFDATQIHAETSLRAIVRAYLCETRPAAGNRLTVFVMASEYGFAVGLWNPSWGLFFERSEPLDITDADVLDDDNSLFLTNFISHALRTAVKSAEEINDEMGFDGIERVIVSTPQELISLTQPLTDELSEMEEIPVEIMPETLEYQIGRGLLYSNLLNNPLTVSDLSRDLYVRLVDNSLEAERVKRAAQAKARTHAFVALCIPFILLAAFVIGGFAHYARQSAMLTVRKSQAEAEAKRLEPITNARNSYIENFKWRESYLRQILSLRDRQTLAISFLPEVDAKTVLSEDSQFAFSELKMNVNGGWMMRGVASSEVGVTNFIKGLEYAENAKGESVFNNLAPELKLGADERVAANASFKSSLAQVPRGMVGWEIKGNYLPLANMAPKPGVAPPVSQPNPAQTPVQNAGSGGQNDLKGK